MSRKIFSDGLMVPELTMIFFSNNQIFILYIILYYRREKRRLKGEVNYKKAAFYVQIFKSYNLQFQLNQKDGMLDKLLGKKETGMKIFNIPDKKYCYDSKKLAKMDKKDLQEVIHDMEKYISNLSEKLQKGKKQCLKHAEKSQQLQVKLTTATDELYKLNHQQEELNIKLMNLKESLVMVSQEKEETLNAEIKYLESHKLEFSKIKDMKKVLEIYKNQIEMSEKVIQQNKSLKGKYCQLENEYYTLSEKFNQKKTAISRETQGTEENKSDEDQEEILIMKSILEGKEQILMSLKKKIENQQGYNVELKQNIAEMEGKMKRKMQIIDEKEQIIEQLEKKNRECVEKLANFQRKQSSSQKQIEKKEQQVEEIKEKMLLLENQNNQIKINLEKLQQNKTIHENASKQHIESIQQSLDKVLNNSEGLKEEIEEKKLEIANLKEKQKNLEEQIKNLLQIKNEIPAKNATIVKYREQVKELEGKVEQLNEKINKNQELYLIKLKKNQSELNQERIKMENMKRSLTNLEAKCEQDKKVFQEMYEKKVKQDRKIIQMQKKLKQYKHIIQCLKKEKQQIQKTLQLKIKGFQEMAKSDYSDDQKIKVQEKQSSNKEENSEIHAELLNLRAKLSEMQNSLIIIQEENEELKQRNSQILQTNTNLQAEIRILKEKRQKIIKQLQKLNNRPEEKQNQEKKKEKKIAEKAYRAFDIIYKTNHQVYQRFLETMINDIQRKQVKQIQMMLNSLIKKIADMKDIFSGYF